MMNHFNEMSNSETWDVLVGAAKRALERAGLAPSRIPGRGRSNIWEIREDGRRKRVSIRTTKNRWFAFPPLEGGKKWKTLDSVEIVVVATVDEPDDPHSIEVYRFDADEVRQRFNANYAARIQAGHIVQDNFGMWVNLDADDGGSTASVGAGLGAENAPIATYPLEELIGETGDATGGVRASRDEDTTAESEASSAALHTISEVMDWARKRIATLSGVRIEAVKLDCRIET